VCSKLIDDAVIVFGVDGTPLQTFVGLPLANVEPDDELELQVVYATTDGFVDLQKGYATSAKPDQLRIRVGALASENAAHPIRVLAASTKFSIYASHASGQVAVIVRQYRSTPCRS
jgi:hypothetical protein